ncbi:uncharacterized protein LOC118647656 [Monomorium pharaonis]|uniref:uncharacterized protein LOC118647656 n=1 Tax=Monomorium pharaonis TaxID=307658 RepID=UPI001746812A|nr:uncharacterized protein LOC118647656 [Monomorium pharaonis]
MSVSQQYIFIFYKGIYPVVTKNVIPIERKIPERPIVDRTVRTTDSHHTDGPWHTGNPADSQFDRCRRRLRIVSRFFVVVSRELRQVTRIPSNSRTVTQDTVKKSELITHLMLCDDPNPGQRSLINLKKKTF